MQAAIPNEELIKQYEPEIDSLFERCLAEAPNFGVTRDMFAGSLHKSLLRFFNASEEPASEAETREFLAQLHVDDLFLALACSHGNERAWWEFDHQHRAYLERVARQLARTEIDAQEVIESVYVELYGTRVVDGARVSKFSSYSGRGSFRGWLRTVIWHSLVDLHRGSHDEVSLDELTENVGEGGAHAIFVDPAPGGEDEMVEEVARHRYQKITLSALSRAFEALESHEKLLLLYYHVDQLKLREIARLVENENSPLRGWFHRKAEKREKSPSARIHESTIMRWLDKSYAKVLQLFTSELRTGQNLGPEEVEICLDLATNEFTAARLFPDLASAAGDLTRDEKS